MSAGTGNRNKRGIKYVTRKRNPAFTHESEKLLEVFKARILHKEARREHPQFIKRLQGLRNGIDHRQKHECAEDNKNDVNSDVAADRAVK